MLLGVLMGAVLGELMLIHMAAVTEKVLKSEDQVSAEKTAAFHSVLRKLIFFGIIALILWTESWRLPAAGFIPAAALPGQ